jgi:hypothetical protein
VDTGQDCPIHSRLFLAERQEVVMMVVRIARILSAGVMLVVLAGVRPAMCEGWSLSNPFASKTETTRKSVTKPAKKEPSMLEKFGTGTKNFFNKTGEAIGLKKPEAKKPQYASPTPPKIQALKKPETKSWVSRMFQPEEPPKPTNVKDWMAQPRQDL